MLTGTIFELIFYVLTGIYVLWMIFTAFENGFGKGLMKSLLICIAVVGSILLIIGLNWISVVVITTLLIFKPNLILPDFGKSPSLK